MDMMQPSTSFKVEGKCLCVDATSDGTRALTGDSSGKAILWDPTTKRQLVVLECAGAVNSVDLSSDRAVIATGDESGKASLWNTTSGALIRSLQCAGAVTSVEISGDDDVLATGDASGKARVWDVRPQPNPEPLGLFVAPDPRTCWHPQVNTGEHVREMDVGVRIRSIDLSSDMTLLVSGDDNRNACLWKLSGRTGNLDLEHVEVGQLVRNFTCGHNVYSVKLTQDSALLATGDAMSKAKIWDVLTSDLLHTLDCGGWVHSVYFSGDKTMLATGDQGKTARLWNVSSGELVYTLQCEGEAHGVDLSYDKSMLTVGDSSGSVMQWAIALGGKCATFECGGDVNGLDLSRNFVATGGPDNTIKVFETASSRRVHLIRCEKMVLSVDISSDETLIASGDAAGKAILWSMDDARWRTRHARVLSPPQAPHTHMTCACCMCMCKNVHAQTCPCTCACNMHNMYMYMCMCMCMHMSMSMHTHMHMYALLAAPL
eukprot:3982340-Prymnesium_polylepis.2